MPKLALAQNPSSSSESEKFQALGLIKSSLPKLYADDPDRHDTVLIGFFNTLEEVRKACKSALKEHPEYIGYTYAEVGGVYEC